MLTTGRQSFLCKATFTFLLTVNLKLKNELYSLDKICLFKHRIFLWKNRDHCENILFPQKMNGII